MSEENTEKSDVKIVDESPSKKCFSCGFNNIKLVLVLDGNRTTKNFTTMCSNPECFRHWDLEKTPSWVPAVI